jgi:cytochrome c biogenesis protein
MKIRYLLVRSLANLQFAIILLLTIAGLSTLGSIIEQNQPIEYYEKNYAIGVAKILNEKIIIQFGLDHIFTTWWFVSLLVIFGTSLTCCTFLQQLPILKAARQFKFYNSERKFAGLPFKTKVDLISNGTLINVLEKADYQSFQQASGVYSNKGIAGRISPIIVHFSMVVILCGTLLASFAGFVAQEFVPETEVFHVQNLVSTNVNTFVPQVAGRVNDFWILYKEDQSISQFYTDLSILDNRGNELKRETIYVNHPLKYGGLTFYQTDWDVLGIRLKLNDIESYQIPILKPTKKVWFAWLPTSLKPNVEGIGYTLVNSGIRGASPVYNQNGQRVGDSELHESISDLENLKLIEFINATGIQIKADPGLSVIYSGFFLLLISIMTSYLSYSQIWLSKFQSQLIIGGFTNRAKIQFEFEVLNFGLQFQKLKQTTLEKKSST